MKTSILLMLFVIFFKTAASQEFKRDMPDDKLLSQFSAKMFPNYDAFIILKEQSYNLHETVYYYRGYPNRGLGATKTVVKIVKLFTEKAVSKWGNFEYSYSERMADEFPCKFEMNMRVLKTDGQMWVMPEDDLIIKVTRENREGVPLNRTALIKIPDLKPGDVIQMEYTFFKPFSINSSGFFFYNDEDPILYSNLYLTVPSEVKIDYKSFPANQIGPPQTLNLSDDEDVKTFFWSVKKLYNIPDEPYSSPFADQSLMTTFVVNQWSETGDKTGTWDNIAEKYSDVIDKDKDDVDEENIQILGFTPEREDSTVTVKTVDSLYRAIRQKIVLTSNNSIYPLSEDINYIFEKQEGDASDDAYIMENILNQWGVTAQYVLVRDRRQGIIEKLVPSTKWFDRMAIMVNIGDTRKLYDFDRCIPCNYNDPWFDKGISLFLIDDVHGTFIPYNKRNRVNDNYIFEMHNVALKESENIYDESSVMYNGYFADNFRKNAYGLDKSDIKDLMAELFADKCLENCDSLWYSDFENEKNVKIYAHGKSNIKVENIDQMKVFHPGFLSLSGISDRLFSGHRFNDIDFKNPFKINVIYNFSWPKDMKLISDPPSGLIQGPERCMTKITSFSKSNGISIKFETLFPKNFIQVKNYKNLIDFIKKSINKAQSDITIQKAA